MYACKSLIALIILFLCKLAASISNLIHTFMSRPGFHEFLIHLIFWYTLILGYNCKTFCLPFWHPFWNQAEVFWLLTSFVCHEYCPCTTLFSQFCSSSLFVFVLKILVASNPSITTVASCNQCYKYATVNLCYLHIISNGY